MRVGEANRIFVVLDDEERIAEVAQRSERIEQARVVPRMQADGRLVENIEDALYSEPNCAASRIAALRPGKRGGGAVERQ